MFSCPLLWVSPLYFFDDREAARVEADLALLAALRDAGVPQIALRAAVLEPPLQAAVAELVERLVESQQSRQRRSAGDSNGTGAAP